MINYIDKINTFDDFTTIVNPLTNKEKGDLFEELTKYIFKYHPNYCQFTKEVYLLNEVPLNLLKQLNLPTSDQGIDLILQDKYNKYHAIQCKYRSNTDEIIPWSDLGTFYGLAFGIAKGFSGGFYVTNTTEITQNAAKSSKVIPLYGEFFNDLTDFFTILKTALLPNISVNSTVMIPRSYQTEIIEETIVHFLDNNRGVIESACGTGKTLTTYWIDTEMNNSLTVVAVPSLFLLSQFYADWAKQMQSEKLKADFILVGSDADCGEVKFENNGLIITTSVKEIANSLKWITRAKDYKIIIITTYQSSDKLIQALSLMKLEPDLCVFDEAHKTVGQTGTQFSLLLDDTKLTIKKRLFVTATPKVYNGGVDDSNMLSMDDEEWYGKTIYTYNTSDAIKDGYLVDYQIVTMYTDDTYIETMVKKNKYIWYDNKIIDSQYMAIGIMLLNEFQKADCTHLVTYHNSVAKSKEFKELLGKLNETYKLDIKILNVDGTHSMKHRTRIFKEFTTSKLSILVSARVLNEGVNIPIIDSVCFVDPRTSTIDIIQCFGRALRLYGDKKMAKIYVPIIVDDIEQMDENKVFGNLIRVLKCLSETDINISDYFSAMKSSGVCDRKLIRHDNCLSVEKIGENINVMDWMNGIDVKLWKKVDSWECNYNELVKWVAENGRIPTPMSRNELEKKIGSFCHHQRDNKKRGRLSIDKINKLESLDGWFWKLESSFDRNYENLKQWVETHKRIPRMESKVEPEKTLGSFCGFARQKKKKGLLTNEEINKLESIDGWFWKLESAIDKNYDNLKQWIDTNKRMPSTTSNDDLESKLGSFCHNQKVNKRKNKLTDDQIIQLEKIEGWTWGNQKGNIIKSFDDSYNDLKSWCEINGKLPSQSSNDVSEKKLGKFCSRQRENKNNDKLTNEEIRQLEKIKNWYWNDKPKKIIKSFDENCVLLKEWINNNNKMPRDKSKDKIESQLGVFCSTQRQKMKTGKLDEEKIQKLNVIPHWYWNSKVDILSFDDSVIKLKKWISENDRLPLAHSNDQIERRLGSFCSTKRYDKKQGELDDQKIKTLSDIAYWYWEAENIFEKNCENLIQWIKINNKFPNFSSKNPEEKKIASFCGNQRQNKKKGLLTDDEITILEAIPYWFWGKDEIKTIKTFDETYDELKVWVIVNKKLPSANSKDLSERILGMFCARQRENKKKDKLTNDQINKMEEIKYWFWKVTDVKMIKTFDENYNDLKQWIETNKKIPNTHSKDITEKKLSGFCSDKKKHKKQGKLSEEQITKLEGLPGWCWSK